MKEHTRYLGLPVARAERVLSSQASRPMVESPEELAALDAEPPEVNEERAAWRVRLAERRMREAYLALEGAEQRGAAGRKIEQLLGAFMQESVVYDAAMAEATRRGASTAQT